MFLKSFFWQGVNSLIKIFLEIFVFNRKIRRILKGNWTKFYLRKYVRIGTATTRVSAAHEVLLKTPPSPLERENVVHLPLWQYWESQDNSIPPLVQACLNSVDLYKGNYKRILLSPDNVKEYVNIPQIFWNLKEKGIIKTAFFSDILRTCLLLQYGGIWIDATVLLTEEIPSYITDSELFVFQNDLKIDLDGLNMASYFISAKKDNKILRETLASLTQYWKENRFLVNYFAFLHTFTMVTQATNENKELFSKVPFFSFLPVQQFQRELLNKFSEERYNEIKKMSGIHKLTHKQSVLTKQKNIDISGTFYEHIIKDFGEGVNRKV